MLEADLRKLLEATADAAMVVDPYGSTLFWNHAAEKLFGIPAADAVGRPCAELIDARDSLGNRVCRYDCAVLASCAARKEVRNFDVEAGTRAGRRRWVNVSVLRFEDRHGRPQCSIHLMRDIGQRKHAEDLYEKLLEAARELVKYVSVRGQDAPVSPLSDQERKVLRGLAEGRTPEQIAARLRISARTLRNHLSNANRKLGTRNRLAAVVHAARRGLI